MISLSRRLLVVSAMASLALPCFAQSDVISAKSGLLHYFEGTVLLGDKAVESRVGVFPDIKEKQELRTEQGRAEVLLNPGVFLRVGENSAIRMLSTRLIDTRVDFLNGSAIVEVDDPLKENSVTVVYSDFQVHLKKHGLYRFDSQPAQLRVYNGEAEVESGGNVVTVKEGKLLAFSPAMAMEKFDNKVGDSLYRWAKRRSEYESVANMSAAKSLRDSGNKAWNASSWYWNPYYSMYTYIPGRGVFYSPFGYGFWSPYTIYSVYYPSRGSYSGFNNAGNSGYGYSTIAPTSSGYSGAVASAPVSNGGHVSTGTAASGGSSAVSGAASGGHGGGGHGR